MYTNIILCLHKVYYYYLYMNIDYILNKSIKILLSSFLTISIVIILIFTFPPVYVHAESLNQYDFTDQPYSTGDTQIVYTVNNAPRKISFTQAEDVYIFYVSDSLSNYLYLASPNSQTVRFNRLGDNDSIYDTWSLGCINLDSNSNLYYVKVTNVFSYPLSDTTYVPYIPAYNSLTDALNDIISSNTPSISLYEGLNIPPGYIARIQVKNGSQFTMLTTMGTDNIAYQDKWVYTSQWYKFNDTSNPETAMATDGITIPWIRYGNTNILGQTNRAQYTINSSVGSYVWVLNPAYMVGQNADLYDTKLNSSIQLTDVIDVLQVRIFALKSTYTWGGIVSSTSTGSGIEYDPESGNWLNDNGDPVDPVDYGDTNVPTTGTTLIQQFETLLSNLINRIERLLVAPVDYINQLIQSANQFFLWLRGLWSWLPAPVVESISAVLIIMCTVGALKLLWR